MAGGGSQEQGVLAYRAAREDDLVACTEIWSAGIEDYVRRLNQPWFAGDMEPLRRLLAHFLRTDPDRFRVATSTARARAAAGSPGGDAGERVVAFASATMRQHVWFLGMLFVLPEFQARGVGRRLLERVLPATRAASTEGEVVLATATDSVQPISNALYSRYGMVPKLPVFNLVGRPRGAAALPGLPPGVRIVETNWSASASTLDAEAAEVGRLDAAVLGFAHPQDHALLRTEGRRRFLARAERGDLLGYGYAAPSGRFGPVAAFDAALMAPIVAHLVTAVRAPGAYASWIPGDADAVVLALLAAGFRFEAFPTLLLWNRRFADFSRYVPINLALL